MENEFRNLTEKVWRNFDNPIKSMIFQHFEGFFNAALSGRTLLNYVMSQQDNSLMEVYTQISLSLKIHPPSTFILQCVTIAI